LLLKSGSCPAAGDRAQMNLPTAESDHQWP
jgi:hypothetical protein